MPPQADWTAYDVGASFIYIARDKYGKEKLLTFFTEIGRQGKLEGALAAVFNKTVQDFEKEWGTFLRTVKIPEPPQITRLLPADGAKNISTLTPELLAEFDRPMVRRISVGSPCDNGICYKNAYWKTDRILAIKVEGPLKPNTGYSLTLGTGQGLFQSAEGAELPLTRWSFTTAK